MIREFLLLKNKGFTLLEVIIVLGIMSMFLMLAIPAAGMLEQTQRIINTRERMGVIRSALLGKTPFDEQGRRQVDGYTGDMGALPELLPSVWDFHNEIWLWPTPSPLPLPPDIDEFEYFFYLSRSQYFDRGLGQPRGLWLNVTNSERWRGPYMPEPMDERPGNEGALIWNPLAEPGSPELLDSMEFEMRRTNGKLADAWGRSLLFFYVDAQGHNTSTSIAGATTVYIVSEGSDMKSEPPAYDLNLGNNRDNIVFSITPIEWTDETRIHLTRQKLLVVEEALIGSREAEDRFGRRLSGGYTGDLGNWPKVYTWEQDPVLGWIWIESIVDTEQGIFFSDGSLRALWTDDPDGEGTEESLNRPPNPILGLEDEPQSLGFGWRGPYLPTPDGQGAEQVLRDAWGTPIRFRRIYSSEQNAYYGIAESIIITSAGPDAIYDNTDDISQTLSRSLFDVRGRMLINVTLVNETGMDLTLGRESEHIKVRFHTSSVVESSFVWPPLGYATSTIPGSPESMALYGNRLNLDNIPVDGAFAGTRLIEVARKEVTGQETRLAISYVDVTDKGFISPGLKSNDPVVLTIR